MPTGARGTAAPSTSVIRCALLRATGAGRLRSPASSSTNVDQPPHEVHLPDHLRSTWPQLWQV